MKPVVTRLYAVLVALTLVGLSAWAGADWYQHRQAALDQGRSLLRTTAGHIADLTIRNKGWKGEDLATLMQRGPAADSRWKVLTLSSPERGTEFYRGPRPAAAIDREVPRWGARPFSEVAFELPVFRATGAPMALEGIYEFYGRGEIFGLLRACGLTLMGLLIMTIVVTILSLRRSPDRETDVPAGVTGEPVGTPETRAEDEPMDWGSPSIDEALGSLDERKEEEYWFDDELTLDDLPPLDRPVEDDAGEPAPGPKVRDPAAGAGSSDPSLFSPDTGLGWESFLSTRLDNELDRAAGQNQDLSLILLKPRSPVDPRAWGQAVRQAFPSVDLNFEFQGGAAVVLPGRSLEQALKAARSFVEDTERQWGVAAHAGLSSRSGRLLSGKTLREEAESALRRTLAGSVRVMGLKTDPDRWRDHLSSA